MIFSLVASNRLSGKHEGHTVAIPESDSRVLRAGVIYGANGAGKSNLFKALRLLKTVATATRKRDAPIPREAFRFRKGLTEPTVFDLQFIVQGRLYRYGVKLDDTQVLEEWLIRISHGSEKVLYERQDFIREKAGSYNKTRLRREHFAPASALDAILRSERLDAGVPGGDIPQSPTTRVYKLLRASLRRAFHPNCRPNSGHKLWRAACFTFVHPCLINLLNRTALSATCTVSPS